MKKLISFINTNKLGEIKENVSFKVLTTYKSGGNARLVVFPNSIKNLKKLFAYLKDNNISYKVFGNGSNILASDKDYDGVIIKLTKLNRYRVLFNYLKAGAGCNLMGLSNTLCKCGYSGFEFACGIPGTLGGAIYMNAGAYLKDISDVLLFVKVLDLEDMKIKKLCNRRLEFNYRTSIFQKDNRYVILEGNFKLKKKDRDTIMNLIVERKKRRVESQPLEFPSAGSVFRNPVDNYAGKLIEDSNLKGYSKGGAEVSLKHANFIINKDNASSQDIKDVMDYVHNTVLEKYDVDLKREQELFNWE